jgi:hypothetical protein
MQNTTHDMIAVFNRRQPAAPIANAHSTTRRPKLTQIHLGDRGQVGNDAAVVGSPTADEPSRQGEQRDGCQDDSMTADSVTIGCHRHLDNAATRLGQVGLVMMPDAKPALTDRALHPVELDLKADTESGWCSNPPALCQLGQVLKPQWSAWPAFEPFVDWPKGTADHLKPRLILDLDPAPEITRPGSGFSSQPRCRLVEGDAGAHLAV